MLDAERRQRIVALVERDNGATVGQLSKQFGVSDATVRRDLLHLSQRGLIERAHGGAAPRRGRHLHGLPEPPLLKRALVETEAKRRIAAAAAATVVDGETIIVAGGTTTAEMAGHLAERRRLTVLTNALNIALLLAPHPGLTVIVLGGAVRQTELTMHGSLAEDALVNLRAAKLFYGTPALHAGHGLSVHNLAEAQTDRALMAAAEQVVVLADHTKFGQITTMRVAPIARVHRVITDLQAPAEEVAILREHGVIVDLV